MKFECQSTLLFQKKKKYAMNTSQSFLGLSVNNFGGAPPSGMQFRKPGAYHIA